MALIDKLINIADAIRSKTGKTELLTLDNMATEIAGITMGVELNFEVIGGIIEPNNPMENTIWVNTDIEISRWIFCTTQPIDAVNGMIWFSTGKNSVNYFDALVENDIIVYPLGAKQYVDGSWSDIDVRIYKDGKWVNLIVYLFSYGETFDSVSGGWSNVSGDHLVGDSSGTYSRSGNISALKDYQTLHFSYKITNVHGSGNGNVAVVIKSTSNSILASWSTPTNGLTSTEVCMGSLDISSISTDCYITFEGWYGTAYYFELWLE